MSEELLRRWLALADNGQWRDRRVNLSLATHPLVDQTREYLATRPTPPSAGDAETLTHSRSCSYFNDEIGCTCCLEERRALTTERAMHAAWRKRAEEAELALTQARREERERAAKKLDDRAEALEIEAIKFDGTDNADGAKHCEQLAKEVSECAAAIRAGDASQEKNDA
jgi:hypothetical protein